MAKKTPLNFFYENSCNIEFEDMLNLQSCKTTLPNGMPIYDTCPSVEEMREFNYASLKDCYIRDDHYLIFSGLRINPDDWAGWGEDQQPFIKYLSDANKQKMREGKALLLLDQTLEGYHDERLWPWFHKVMEEENLPIESLIYNTGNLLAPKQYENYIGNNKNKMKVIGNAHFSKAVISQIANGNEYGIKMQDHYDYKGNNETLTFNVLQKRPRFHRCWFFSALKTEQFLTEGIFSMQQFDVDLPEDLDKDGRKYEYDFNFITSDLPHGPSNQEKDDLYYIRRLNNDVCLKTFVTVVSEASFFDSDDTLFISEKTFKPIASRHPFIIFGNRGSLKALKEMGFRTFDDFWDESYDDLPTWERFDAIIKLMHNINKREDKLQMFREMEDILEHNFYTLLRMYYSPSSGCQEIMDYYREYFNVT